MENNNVEMTIEQQVNSCEHSISLLFRRAEKEFIINDMCLINNKEGVKLDLYGVHIKTRQKENLYIHALMISKLLQDLQKTTKIKINSIELNNTTNKNRLLISYNIKNEKNKKVRKNKTKR